MAHRTITVEKLTPTIGAEISGVDLRELSDQQFERIHDALMKHLVIFFRNQSLTPDQQKAVGRRFGKIEGHRYAAATNLPGHPEIWVLERQGSREKHARFRFGEFHADITCDEAPPMGAVLAIQELPEGGGGDTLWASMYAAYEGLSDPISRLVEGLTAIHTGRVFETAESQREGVRFPISEHPVVRTHPVTGRRGLFVNRTFTDHIVQLSPAESDAVLRMLYEHIARPEYQCRFRWEPGSVAIWDNRCTQHNPIHDYHPSKRRVHRVTIAGNGPS
jgi:taurine dioxygenase